MAVASQSLAGVAMAASQTSWGAGNTGVREVEGKQKQGF